MRIRWYVLVFGLFALGLLLVAVVVPGLVPKDGTELAAPAQLTETPRPATAEDAPKPVTQDATAGVAVATADPAAPATEPAPAAPVAAGAEDGKATALVAEIRALLPKRLDRLTTFADVRYASSHFTFVFLFPFVNGEVDADQLATLLRTKVTNGFCKDPYVVRIFELGADVETVFKTADGVDIYKQGLTPAGCA